MMKKKMKRKQKTVAGVLTAALFMTIMVVPLHAADGKELDNLAPERQETNTDVEAEVHDLIPGSPTYTIRVPSSIDFGVLKPPAVNINSYMDIPFQVELTEAENLSHGSVVSVLVRPQNTPVASAPPHIGFTLSNQKLELQFSMYTGSPNPDEGTDVENNRWYENGYLFGAFSANAEIGSVIPGSLRINQKQLYGQDPNTYVGDYIGGIHFYSKVANAADYM